MEYKLNCRSFGRCDQTNGCKNQMANEWQDSEIEAYKRTYLWMQTSLNDGFRPVEVRIWRGLIAVPVSRRTLRAIEYRFQNISAVLDVSGEQWVRENPPPTNVGALTRKRIPEFIEAFRQERNRQKLGWLV